MKYRLGRHAATAGAVPAFQMPNVLTNAMRLRMIRSLFATAD